VNNIDHALAPSELIGAAHDCWNRALQLGEQNGIERTGHRAGATGTIRLLMDCDTTGVEPDFALIKFKKLAGGRQLQDREPVVPRALKKLGTARRRCRPSSTPSGAPPL